MSITTTTTQSDKVFYTGKTHTTGGRNGKSQSSDGNLDIKLAKPGSNGTGTNPEQLFAAGWSACFEGAMEKAAQRIGLKLPEDTFIDAEVDLCADAGEFWLQARLNISLPGIHKAIAQQVVETAHTICPYSKAITGNVHVEFNIL
ncbi:MAG TPA: organic hydroperoxide resistance protein [Niastella sp.]